MNSKTVAAALLVGFAAISMSLAQNSKPDFTGNWALDKEKSEGLPAGMNQSMTVKQAGDKIEVEVQVSGPQGDRTVADTYVLNGEPTEFTPPLVVGGAAAEKGKRISKWAAGAVGGFDATEEAVINRPDGREKLSGERHWRLSEDKKTLTVQMVLDGSQGPSKSTRVFTRK